MFSDDESIITYSPLASTSDVIKREYTTGEDLVASFECLYLTYKPRIYKRLVFMVKRPDIAEELCQETFLKAWRYWPPKNNKNLYGWLHLIATNIVRDTITNGHLRIERGEVLSFDFSFFTEEDITHDIEDTKQGDITEHCARNELRQQAWNGLMAEHKQALARYQVRQPVDMKIVFHARKAYKDRYKRLIRQSEVAS